MNLKKWAGPFSVMVLTAVLVKTTYPYIRHETVGTGYAIVIGISGAFGYTLALRYRDRKRSNK